MQGVGGGRETTAVLCITNSKGSGGPAFLHCQGGSGETSGWQVVGKISFADLCRGREGAGPLVSETTAVLCITNNKGSGGPALLPCQGGGGEISG